MLKELNFIRRVWRNTTNSELRYLRLKPDHSYDQVFIDEPSPGGCLFAFDYRTKANLENIDMNGEL